MGSLADWWRVTGRPKVFLSNIKHHTLQTRDYRSNKSLRQVSMSHIVSSHVRNVVFTNFTHLALCRMASV